MFALRTLTKSCFKVIRRRSLINSLSMVGCSVICDCGISWLYSLTFSNVVLCVTCSGNVFFVCLFLVDEVCRIQMPRNASHHRAASETPFKWRFAGVPIMVQH